MSGLTKASGSRQILRFLIAGGITTLGYLLLTLSLSLWLSQRPVVTNVLAYLVCLFISFFLQKLFAFRGDDAVRREFPRFLASALLGLVLSTSIVSIGVRLGIEPAWCFLAVAVIVAPLSYVLLDRFVFRSKDLGAAL